MNSTINAERGRALDELDSRLAAKDLEAFELNAKLPDLCAAYHRVRPLVEMLLPVLDRVNERLGKLVRLLVRLADAACPDTQ